MKQTIYITKYALTTGIIEVEATLTDNGKSANYREPRSFTNYLHKGDFFLTLPEAIEDFRIRIIKKKENLIKQMAKLEKIKPDKVVKRETV